MTIKLYTNNSEEIKMDKNLTEIYKCTSGLLKEPTDIKNPVIQLSGISAADIAKCNYMEISEFGRYYFISPPKSIRDGLWEVSGHVDVLMSFKNDIRACSAVIKRQENNWNLYLDDGIFKAYQNPLVVTKLFPSGLTNNAFILTMAGSPGGTPGPV